MQCICSALQSTVPVPRVRNVAFTVRQFLVRGSDRADAWGGDAGAASAGLGGWEGRMGWVREGEREREGDDVVWVVGGVDRKKVGWW